MVDFLPHLKHRCLKKEAGLQHSAAVAVLLQVSSGRKQLLQDFGRKAVLLVVFCRMQHTAGLVPC